MLPQQKKGWTTLVDLEEFKRTTWTYLTNVKMLWQYQGMAYLFRKAGIPLYGKDLGTMKSNHPIACLAIPQSHDKNYGVDIYVPAKMKKRAEKLIAFMVALNALFGFGYFFYLTSGAQMNLGILYFFVAANTACTGVITVIMTCAGEYYDDDIRATGTGVVGTINIVGRYLGPWLAGMVIDATGVVGDSFLIVGITMAIAAVIAFAMPKRGVARKRLQQAQKA